MSYIEYIFIATAIISLSPYLFCLLSDLISFFKKSPVRYMDAEGKIWNKKNRPIDSVPIPNKATDVIFEINQGEEIIKYNNIYLGTLNTLEPPKFKAIENEYELFYTENSGLIKRSIFTKYLIQKENYCKNMIIHDRLPDKEEYDIWIKDIVKE